MITMIELKSCPICDYENIDIRYDNRTGQFKMYCSSCDKVYNLSKKVKIKCPICESHDIRYDEDVTCCGECGTVLASTSHYVAGKKIILPWGLIL